MASSDHGTPIPSRTAWAHWDWIITNNSPTTTKQKIVMIASAHHFLTREQSVKCFIFLVSIKGRGRPSLYKFCDWRSWDTEPQTTVHVCFLNYCGIPRVCYIFFLIFIFNHQALTSFLKKIRLYMFRVMPRKWAPCQVWTKYQSLR